VLSGYKVQERTRAASYPVAKRQGERGGGGRRNAAFPQPYVLPCWDWPRVQQEGAYSIRPRVRVIITAGVGVAVAQLLSPKASVISGL